MTTVLLGSNRFVDCTTLIGFKNAPLLQVTITPLRVILSCPEELIRPDDAPEKIIEGSSSFSIFRGVNAVAIATLFEQDVIHLKLDLRPLGLHVYDDVMGLHVGKNVFANNTLERISTAINLA